MSFQFFETHAHLDYLKEFPLETILERSRLAGVDRLLTVAVDKDNQDQALALAERFENVICSQGIHPHDSKDWNEELALKIRANLKSSKVRAIGEIGLDYHYDNSPREVQREVFEAQMELVVESGLPVIIHSREAEEDTIAIIKAALPRMKKRGVIHCFTSNETLARFALDEGFFLGFNGIITFKAAENVREILRLTPNDRILLETDCPFLAPIPYRGKENHPFYIPAIAQKLAEVKATPLEVLAPLIYENSIKLFS